MNGPDLRAIAAHYGGEISGDECLIPTPGHSSRDRGTSIRLAPGAPDGLIVHCFNEEQSEALAVKDMLRRDGLLPALQGGRSLPLNDNASDGTSFMPDISELFASWPQNSTVLEEFSPKSVWEYNDATGEIAYRKRRIDMPDGGKTFVFEHPDGNGGWIKGKGGRNHILYRLPELLNDNELIFAAEGERCADKLAHWGLTSTSTKDLDKCDLSPLKTRMVAILPDNDEPGVKCAQAASQAILRAGGKPFIVELPNLPKSGDIVDWGGTLNELRMLVEASLQDNNLPHIRATPFQWRDASEIPTRPWVLGHWLLRQTVTCLVAPGGSGKSTFISAMALALASGSHQLLAQDVHLGPKRVWVWNLEDDIEELSRSIQAAAKHHNISEEMLSGRLFVDSGLEGAELCTAVETRDGVHIIKPVFEALRNELLRRQIDVLVVDPFVSSHEVEENSNSKIDKVAKEWGRLAKAANCCVILAHHTSKAGSGEVNAMSARGAVALINAARSTLVINRMSTDQAKRYGIEEQDVRQYINVSDDKHNRAPHQMASWFKLTSVDLANGPMALGSPLPGDNVGVIEVCDLSQVVEVVPPHKIRAVQEKVKGGPYTRESAQARLWVGHAVAEVLELCPSKDRSKIKRYIEQWIRAGYLKVVKITDPNTRKPNVPFIEVKNIAIEDK